MNINKVLKRMREEEKKSGKTPTIPDTIQPKQKMRGDSGFHAKANSQEGAARQRSMGNRNIKPAKSK
ncbi:hypothetical protein HN481_00630 [Candidatus Parcubacteria bacterium]|jgi:hypothetical protein|nr:hypothetical protein [Candidatus Parcubacteria bacterium]